MKDIGKGHARPSTIPNTIFKKVGKLVPRSKIQHLTSYNECNIINSSDFNILFPSNELNDISSLDKIVKYCWSNGYHFQLLINNPQFSSSLVSETHYNHYYPPLIEEIDHFIE